MKHFILRTAVILIVLCTTSTAQAQEMQTALLHHQRNVSTFYGADAFVKAMDAAESGDSIFLSAGFFNPLTADISKNITIIGNGCSALDESKRTTISSNGTVESDINIKCNEFYLEGVDVQGDFVIDCSITKMILKKCIFNNIWINTNAKEEVFNNVCIDRCRISYFTAYGEFNNTLVKNSILADAIQGPVGICFKNCVVYPRNWQNSGKAEFGGTYVNSIVYFRSSRLDLSSSSFRNCILSGNVPENPNCSDCYPVTDFTTIWISGKTGGYYDGTFQLTDEAAAQYLGEDGTQAGIYGGDTPFTDVPSAPRIVSATVAEETDENGKLPIRIEVEEGQH